jgi:UDP-3-O-[3-hydroxymyristoyl] glucosamine N-acyltransferase
MLLEISRTSPMKDLNEIAESIGITLRIDSDYHLGLVTSEEPNTLTYFENAKFTDVLEKNQNIVCVLTTEQLAKSITKNTVVVDDPSWAFWMMHNCYAKAVLEKKKQPAKIHPSALIHERAFVSEFDVEIGENTIIDPHVTIHENVKIGRNCRIRSNTVIGFDGFEQKSTSKGILSVVHDGYVIIEDDVEIGALNSIAKGFRWKDTRISKETKTDSLVHIAHGVSIGEKVRITACSEVSGSVEIGDSVWLGPNCSIINGVSVGSSVVVGIGAVVTKDIPKSVVAAGNPAKILRDVLHEK